MVETGKHIPQYYYHHYHHHLSSNIDVAKEDKIDMKPTHKLLKINEIPKTFYIRYCIILNNTHVCCICSYIFDDVNL